MKKLTMMAVTGLLLMAVTTPVLALGPVDVDAGLALNGKYVWRGMVTTTDPVLQPSVEVSLVGFTAGFWGNVDTNDVNDMEMRFSEVDWILGYGISLPFLNFGAGFINYTFPGSDAPSTTELYIAASANVLLSPSLTIYQDIDQVKGTYWELSASHAVAMSPGMDLELGAGIGLGSESYIYGYFGALPALEIDTTEIPISASLTDYYISAGVPFHPVPMFTVTPSVTYTGLSGDVKSLVDDVDGGESDAFVWGLNASFSF